MRRLSGTGKCWSGSLSREARQMRKGVSGSVAMSHASVVVVEAVPMPIYQ